MDTKISNIKGVVDTRAFITTDGHKYFDLGKAERRQKIINRNDKPCDKCDCSGRVFHDIKGGIGGYEDTCDNCNGHGYLKLQFTKLPKD